MDANSRQNNNLPAKSRHFVLAWSIARSLSTCQKFRVQKGGGTRSSKRSNESSVPNDLSLDGQPFARQLGAIGSLAKANPQNFLCSHSSKFYVLSMNWWNIFKGKSYLYIKLFLFAVLTSTGINFKRDLLAMDGRCASSCRQTSPTRNQQCWHWRWGSCRFTVVEVQKVGPPYTLQNVWEVMKKYIGIYI